MGSREEPPAAGLAIVRRLAEGNGRFVDGTLSHPHQDAARRAELAAGQDPDVIVVTCSDSRVAPEVLFDAGLGDLFAIENAGGLVCAQGQEASTDLASVEYMVDHFRQRRRCGVLLALAHTHCGAVATTLGLEAGEAAGSPHLDLLVQTIRSNIPAAVRRDPGPGNRRAVDANAGAVLASIRQGSEIVRRTEAEGLLLALVATYDLESGRVYFPEALQAELEKG